MRIAMDIQVIITSEEKDFLQSKNYNPRTLLEQKIADDLCENGILMLRPVTGYTITKAGNEVLKRITS